MAVPPADPGVSRGERELVEAGAAPVGELLAARQRAQ